MTRRIRIARYGHGPNTELEKPGGQWPNGESELAEIVNNRRKNRKAGCGLWPTGNQRSRVRSITKWGIRIAECSQWPEAKENMRGQNDREEEDEKS